MLSSVVHRRFKFIHQSALSQLPKRFVEFRELRRHHKTLSRVETDTFSPVFAELGSKFVDFVDVLSEVSERTSCATNVDLLRLYEKWVKTGSRRSGQLLVERGVVPNASIKPTLQ